MSKSFTWIAVAILLTFPLALRAESPEIVKPVRQRKAFDLNSIENLRLIAPTEDATPYGAGWIDKEDGAFRCQTKEHGEEGKGVKFGYRLDQKEPTPILATGWSKSVGVEGNVGPDYSLYLDLVYQDGTTLWGQTHPFPIGDSDWSKGKVLIFPEKPVKYVSFYGLFRGNLGTVYFKDFELFEYDVPQQVVYFDSVPVALDDSAADVPTLATREFRTDGVDEFLAVPLDAILDKNARADFEGATVAATSRKLPGGAEEIVLKLQSATPKDRVFTLYCAFPAARRGEPLWRDDVRNARDVGVNERKKTRKIAEVGAGETSMYPFGVVEGEDGANAIAVAPDAPAFYRIVYNGATRELYVAFDLALTKEKPTAELRVARLLAPDLPQARESLGANSFRAAVDAYRRAYPDAFRVRAVKQGNWMAFAKVSKVKDWQDFGFQFKEGIDEVGEDDSRGLSSFRYTEPMTWWQQIPKSETSPKSREAAIKAAEETALKNEKNEQGRPAYNVAESQALLSTGFRDADGKLYGMLLDTPWCDGVVWSMNDAPGLVELARQGKLRDEINEKLFRADVAPVAGFDVKWNDRIADELYGAPRAQESLPKTREEFVVAMTQPGVDGEYVDSSEGYVTAVLDFDRNHFAGMETPLTFDAKTKRPAIFRGLIAYEYVKRIADDVHARGKLAMANATPSLHFWLTPLLDVLGTETNWNWGGAWRPMPDEELTYRRVLCGGKPFCFLMNTNFDEFSRDASELYMKRAVAYGMFPSFFSQDASTKHYFDNPDLYERDRELFKKYMPIVVPVAEAGWEPFPLARTNDPKVYVERFGATPGAVVASNPLREGERVYLTVFNDSQEEKKIRVELDPELVSFIEDRAATIREMTTDQNVERQGDAIDLGALPAQDVRVYEINPTK